MPNNTSNAIGGVRDFPDDFRTAALAGVLLLQRCRNCGSHNPLSVTELCHRCGSTDLAATPSTGRCRVLSRTYVARPADSGSPRTVVFVELEEGVRSLGIALRGAEVEFDEQLCFVNCDASSGALYFGPRRASDDDASNAANGAVAESSAPFVG
jgi:hypothetical protein